MRAREFIIESVYQPIEVYPQSNDVGGGNIIVRHSVDLYGIVDELEIGYYSKKDELEVKYIFKNGGTVKYTGPDYYGQVLPNNPSIYDVRNQFTKEVGDIMKDNYEKLTVSQNAENDWTLQQIKKARFESVNKNNNYKVMSGGFEAAIKRFDELAASYLEHLKNRNIE